MHPAGPTKSVLFSTYAVLMLLLAASAAAAFLPAGALGKLLFSLGIAAVKTTLVFVIFMQLRYQTALVRVFSVVGFFWLAVAGVLTFADYLTRGWFPH